MCRQEPLLPATPLQSVQPLCGQEKGSKSLQPVRSQEPVQSMRGQEKPLRGQLILSFSRKSGPASAGPLFFERFIC